MRKAITCVLLAAIYCGALAPLSRSAYSQTANIAMKPTTNNLPDGFGFRLSEGGAAAGGDEVRTPAQIENLPKDSAAAIAGRLPAIAAPPDDRKEFLRRAGTLPPPKAGQKLAAKFPSDALASAPAIKPAQSLSVLRYAPDGEVSLAPDLSITFSEPMVAVAAESETASYTPVELTPAVAGRWRWLGTRTLIFDAATRFPMATKFTARVPAGTRSANGQTLGKDFSWTFTTPPPKVEVFSPQNTPVKRDEIIYVKFDQDIEPAAVAKTITMSSGGRAIPFRLATADEEAPKAAIFGSDPSGTRTIAIRAVNSGGGTDNALPADSVITVNIRNGTASAEGPLTTTKDQIFTFRTFGQFKLVRAKCGWSDDRKCSPSDSWIIELTNGIETSSFRPEMVRIDPSVADLNIYPSGNSIYIDGYKKGRTNYRITLDPSLRDSFGQLLGAVPPSTITVAQAPPQIFAQGGMLTLLDPAAKPAYSIFSVNVRAFKVRIYAVQPEDWPRFTDFAASAEGQREKKTPAPGELISEATVVAAEKPDEIVETQIDLSPFLQNGIGNLVLEIAPAGAVEIEGNPIITWAQSTKIGLDAFVDNQQLVGFASSLMSGRPLAGVELSIYPGGAPAQGQAPQPGGGLIDRALTWINDLLPASDAATRSFAPDGSEQKIEIVPDSQNPVTSASGVARLALPEAAGQIGPKMLIARLGSDSTFLPEYPEARWATSSRWFRQPATDSARWFVFDDRGMYRPNEEVSVKGYIRTLTGGTQGDVNAFISDGAFDWSAKDAQGNEIARGSVSPNSFGAFDLKFRIPDNASLGSARVDFTKNGETSAANSHEFQIQEFRRPEFEVAAKIETGGPYLVGEEAIVSATAKYYSGGSLSNAAVNWTVSATPTNYTPPNRGDFTFGKWVPWWDFPDFDGRRPGRQFGAADTKSFSGRTDASGTHRLKINFDSARPPRPYAVTASAAVQDVNRQTWAGGTSLLVHPSSLYIGIRAPRTFVQKGSTIDVESVITDIDGNSVAGRNAVIKAVLKDWRFANGSWSQQTIDEQSCEVVSADAPGKCSFRATQGGVYTISATVMDDRERPNESEITIWVPGGTTQPQRELQQETAQVIPSKKEYAPGETAEILVISPFSPAEGVLTLRREGIVRTERFSIKDSSAILKIPIDESYLPNIIAQVDLTGATTRVGDNGEMVAGLPPRPAFAQGSVNLNISTASRRFSVTAEAREKTLLPGGTTTVDVAVKGAEGQPAVGTEVTLVAVDESVLALSNYQVPDPLSVFYSQRDGGTSDYRSRAEMILANPAERVPQVRDLNLGNTSNLAKAKAAPMAAEAGLARFESKRAVLSDAVTAGQSDAIALRSNFDALALFAPAVTTDADGKATVKLKLPDNLTRYRITAVAADKDKRFGKSESNVTARQPLMVRASAPRFLNFGDRVELPVVVQNQTENDLAVDVLVRASNASLPDAAPLPDGKGADGKRILVKANSREELRFNVSATNVGTARFQFAATSGSFVDAAEISLPVYTPATTEAFAAYGNTDQDGAFTQPIQVPENVFTQFGGLELTTSSTQLQELTDAFLYLTNYPYGCTEQISSRLISIAAMRDVLSAFKSNDMPPAADLEARFAADIKLLAARQRDDGSFGLWSSERQRYEFPFVTIHAGLALALAKQKGYAVPDKMIESTKRYLRNVEKYIDPTYPNQARWTVSAYALYVLDQMGEKNATKAGRLLADATIEKMPFEALGWTLSVLSGDAKYKANADAIVRFLMNRTAETAAAANFVTDYGDGAWLIMYSSRRADGVLLDALIKADPANDLIPKLVRGLLAGRVKGAWSNTQENVFILLALEKYFNAFEKVTPDFVSRVWLGDVYAGEQIFKGRSADSDVTRIPMSYLAETGDANLLIQRQGAGRLYYRIGMSYAPKNLNLAAADNGFSVLRRYEAVDDPADVKQNTDGTWTIKAGRRVRIRLSMIAPSRRYFVALTDNIPAGFEILNPELSVTEAIPYSSASDGAPSPVSSRGVDLWPAGYWFEHQNFRDERAEAFASLLYGGVYEYSYFARATTPGNFIAPPAKAEEMYNAETFGRSSTAFVKIE